MNERIHPGPGLLHAQLHADRHLGRAAAARPAPFQNRQDSSASKARSVTSAKMGTPTMGGIMFILPVVLLTVLLNAASLIGLNVLGRSVLVPRPGHALPTVCSAPSTTGKASAGRAAAWACAPAPNFSSRSSWQLIIALALKYILDVPELFWPGYVEPAFPRLGCTSPSPSSSSWACPTRSISPMVWTAWPG